MNGISGAAVIGITLCAWTVGAQEWRTLESSRQLRGAGPASVRVQYGAGTLDVAPTSDPVLYRMKLRYDAERSAPIAQFDEDSRSVTFGTRSAQSGSWNGKHREGSTLRAEITNAAPIRLSLELGAAHGDIHLGGLRLTDLSLKTGATELMIDFDTPNRESMSYLDVDVGAAKVVMRRAGNARTSRVRINVGAGSLDYDLSGTWEGETELSANVAVGEFTLRAPADVGVRVVSKTFLAGFDKAGLEKRGDAWYTRGYDSARRKVRANVTTVLGNFDLVQR